MMMAPHFRNRPRFTVKNFHRVPCNTRLNNSCTIQHSAKILRKLNLRQDIKSGNVQFIHLTYDSHRILIKIRRTSKKNSCVPKFYQFFSPHRAAAAVKDARNRLSLISIPPHPSHSLIPNAAPLTKSVGGNCTSPKACESDVPRERI